MNPAGRYAATCGINKVAQCLLQLGGKPRASVVGHEMSEGTMSDGFDDVDAALMASKGCVLVSWQPRHQQDEAAADEEASTGSADTEPCTQHVSRHLGRPNVAVLKAFEANQYAGLW